MTRKPDDIVNVLEERVALRLDTSHLPLREDGVIAHRAEAEILTFGIYTLALYEIKRLRERLEAADKEMSDLFDARLCPNYQCRDCGSRNWRDAR